MLGRWSLVSQKLPFSPTPLFFLNTPWWLFWKSQRCIQFITEIGRLYFPCVDFHFRLWWLQDFLFPFGVEVFCRILQRFCDISASVAFLGVKVRWVESVFIRSNLQQTCQMVRFATMATVYWIFFSPGQCNLWIRREKLRNDGCMCVKGEGSIMAAAKGTLVPAVSVRGARK